LARKLIALACTSTLLISGCIGTYGQGDTVEDIEKPDVQAIPFSSQKMVFEGETNGSEYHLFMTKLKSQVDELEYNYSLSIETKSTSEEPAIVVYAIGPNCAILYSEPNNETHPNLDLHCIAKNSISVKEKIDEGTYSLYNAVFDCIGFFIASTKPVKYNFTINLGKNITPPQKYVPIFSGTDIKIDGNFSRAINTTLGFMNDISNSVDVSCTSIQIFHIEKESIVQNGIRNCQVKFSNGGEYNEQGISADAVVKRKSFDYLDTIWALDVTPGKFSASLSYVESSERLDAYLITIGINFSEIIRDEMKRSAENKK
jgi:hypothetical protein